MSRCICCNKILTTFELTRKNPETNQYLDMCNECFRASEINDIINVEERYDLLHVDDIDDDEEVNVGYDEL